MGKGSAPAAPDYTPIAQANEATAAAQLQLGTDSLNFAKQKYADVAPIAKDYLTQSTEASKQQFQQAQDAEARYKSVYQPIEDKFVNQATTWNSPARADEQAGAAKADVAASFDAARETSQKQLESYGIDPSQTRFGALDLSSRVSQAAAMSAAGTQSRRNTEATGLALEGEAINVGKGYPGQVAQSYSGATGAGVSGINTTNSTNLGYGNLMGTPFQYGSLAGQSSQNAVSALNTGFNNQLAGQQLLTQQSANTSSGIGSLVGTAASIAAIALL